jgi:hypothetical protein
MDLGLESQLRLPGGTLRHDRRFDVCHPWAAPNQVMKRTKPRCIQSQASHQHASPLIIFMKNIFLDRDKPMGDHHTSLQKHSTDIAREIYQA